ncbi:mitochondrial 28S ribosomal protein s27 domain-containing protein [Ditylenchus destructor]|nr:mitochondrial 28S ribosomal protein s27 domain-containing protein [Ditylenchus destructor]
MILQKALVDGKISPVDLDIMAVLCTESDQRTELMKMLYKLRHSSDACDILPSTEYATFRLLMKYNDWPRVFTIIRDPFNYGMYLNEHLSCMAMDSLLSQGYVPAAAKIATVIMQQEMFDWPLLNFMSIYSLLKWHELPTAERNFPDEIHQNWSILEPEESDEEPKFMKYAWLKNPHDDKHFDLAEPNALVGKSLEWLSAFFPHHRFNSSDNLFPSDSLRERLIELGRQLQKPKTIGDEQKESNATTAAETSTDENSSENQPEPAAINETSAEAKVTSEEVLETFRPHLPDAEKQLMDFQTQQIEEWDRSRVDRIEMQAKYIDLSIRLQENLKRQKELSDEKELLFFFENRVMYEDRAKVKEKMYSDLMELSEDFLKPEYEGLYEVHENKYKGQRRNIVKNTGVMTTRM